MQCAKNVYKYAYDILVVMLFCMQVFELDKFGVVLILWLFFSFLLEIIVVQMGRRQCNENQNRTNELFREGLEREKECKLPSLNGISKT